MKNIVFITLACLAAPLSAQDGAPERRELWVPSKHLNQILKKHPNAVMLDREQYEALVRDAGKIKPADKNKPPVDSVIEDVQIKLDITRGAESVPMTAKLHLMNLVDGWAECVLKDIPKGVKILKIEGAEACVWNDKEHRLATRGKGRHEVTMEFSVPVVRDANGRCYLIHPTHGAPAHVKIVRHGEIGLYAMDELAGGPLNDYDLPPSSSGINQLFFSEPAPADEKTLLQSAHAVATLKGSQMESRVRVMITKPLGTVPASLKFMLEDDGAHLVDILTSGDATFKQNGRELEIVRPGSNGRECCIDFFLVKPLPDGTGTLPLTVNVPRLSGATRISADVAVGTMEGYELLGWGTQSDPGGTNFESFKKTAFYANETAQFAHYNVAPDKITAQMRRAGDHFSADVDNRVTLSTHEMSLERTVAFQGEEGRVTRATFSLPQGEQFLGLDLAKGEPVEWKQVDVGTTGASTFEIIWPAGLLKAKNSALRLRSRMDIGASGGKLAVENLRVPDATRLAGYVALDFDESWKVSADTTGLEPRDARVTPVRGKMAWFTLREHKLSLDIARNDPVLDAAVVAYALPLAKKVEIEGQFTLDVSRAPLREFEVALPVGVSQLLRVDSPLVGTRSLDEKTGIWRFSLRKELLGTANVRFHLSLPAAEESTGASRRLAASLPVISLATARRFTGAWIVEANTDTELDYKTRGVQPLDASQPPAVEGYHPRHRVIAVFGWGASPHEVKIIATRHESGALVAAVIETMNLTSVLSADGSARHEALLNVRHNGQQFFGLQLPKGATLLSASSEGDVVKPVRAGDDEVRVPLPGGSGAGGVAEVKVIYETHGDTWTSSGRANVEPPSTADNVPVLCTNWRVFAPEGREYQAEGGLGPLPADRTPLLARKFVDATKGILLPAIASVATEVSTRSPWTLSKKSAANKEKSEKGDKVLTDRFAKTGYVSLDLTVPASGRVLNFSGHQKPRTLVLHHQTWERQMVKAVCWMVGGMLLFFSFGRRRPWFATVAAALLLTCLPVAFAPSWLGICNAVLLGWLMVFAARILWSIASRMEKIRERLVAMFSPAVPAARDALVFLAMAATFLFPIRSEANDAPQPPDPAAHTVIVPFDPKLPLHEQKAERYYLDYTDFQKLWALAKENRRPPEPADAGAPRGLIITSALYDAEVLPDNLHLVARLSVVTRGGKWQKLPLDFKSDGLSIGEVRLDGQMAGVEKGAVLIENPGQHLVEVLLDVRRPAGWSDVEVMLPATAAAVAAVMVPDTDGRPVFDYGNGPPAVEEVKDGRRVFTVPLGTTNALKIKRTPFRKLVSDTPPAGSDSRVAVSVLPGVETIEAEIAFDFEGVSRDRFTLLLDDSLHVTVWNIPRVRELKLSKADGRLRADITLTRAVADRYKIRLKAERVFAKNPESRTTPMLAGVAGKQASVFDFRVSEELRIKPDSGAAQRVESRLQAENGMTSGGAFRVLKDGALQYSITRRDKRGVAKVEAVYQLGAQKAEIIAAITLDSGQGAPDTVRVGAPQGFEVQTLAGPRVRSWHRDGSDIVIALDGGEEREVRFILHVAKTLDRAVSVWKMEPLKLPGLGRHEGVALVAVHAADDVRIAFDEAGGSLREADPATLNTALSVAPPFVVKRALTMTKPEWDASVTLERQKPKFAVDAVLLARATNEGVKFSQQTGVILEQGVINSVRLRLSKDLPEARVTGPRVRDAKSKIVGDVREYEVAFQDDVLDRADFSLDFETPIDGVKILPVPDAPDASRAQRFFVVDNLSDREMKIDSAGAQPAAKDSLPYIPDNLARPVFYRVNDRSVVKLSFSQLESTAGNAAIVTLAEITTAIRSNGERWETVVYSLANRALQFLPVKLATDAELVEVSVGGQSVRADRSVMPGVWLVPLIQMRAGELSQQVRLVYRLPSRGKEATGEMILDDPELVGLSAERTLWHVWAPKGFVIKKSDGNMDEVVSDVVANEKQQQKLADVVRLNRVMNNLSSDSSDWAAAQRNAENALREVKEYQKSQSGKRRELAQRADLVPQGQAKYKELEQSDQDLEKQLKKQEELYVGNATKAAVNPTQQNRGYNYKTDGKKTDQNANWAGQKVGQTEVANKNFDYQRTANANQSDDVVAFNDNVQVGQQFLKDAIKNTSGASPGAQQSQQQSVTDENGARQSLMNITNNGRANIVVNPKAVADQPFPGPPSTPVNAPPGLAGSGSGGFVHGVMPSENPADKGQTQANDPFAPQTPPAPLIPQMQAVGRVSLAVNVPLEGTEHHFRKIKDHALVELKLGREFTSRQAGALWLLLGGVVLLGAFEGARRFIGHRRAAR